MDDSFLWDAPFVESILHPSDFSMASQNAFAHALVVSLLASTEFTVLHAGGSQGDEQQDPERRATRARVGLREEGSERQRVYEEFAVKVRKINVRDNNPYHAAIEFLKHNETDLIILSTEGRDGLPRWFKPSVAEKIALKSHVKTLFVPQGSDGFVAPDSGEISLNSILVPIAYHPSPLPALEYAARAASMSADNTRIFVLYVGDEEKMPVVNLPEIPTAIWNTVNRQGDVVETIVASAGEYKSDLIVMSTAGHEGILDAMRGSVTQQVLRQAGRPLLAVPTD
jgi:nucleotide-binding universal stress UspA family protein